ncbi:rhodanese-related sulfurtransferase [Candidatus Pacearchaeota archaeon]|nr:rhodanese-related sulfurtransferase [Candidatus Pacearchaeota archaeon]
MIKVLLFYKFNEITDPEYFVRKHKQKCKELGVLGKVLVAKEGINGSVSGTPEQMEAYKVYMHSLPGFEDVWFKEETAIEHPFTKMEARVRKEIIRLDKPVNMNNKGSFLTPQEFLDFYNKEDFIVLDARNYYEYDLGRFKNAINPAIKSFREFPQFVDNFEKSVDKKKKIVMYCTGGIRCEKASAYMKERGFENVYQLEGGIINFCQQLPNTVWEGKCFVFDKRLLSDINQNNKPITHCISCNIESDLLKNCKHLDCDKLVVLCVECQKKLQGCCSEDCLKKFTHYARERAALKKSGEWKAPEIIQNYTKS